jgi:putative peptidoglycan lipid II flippase
MTLRPVVAILGFDEAGTDLVLWTARAYLLGLMGHSLLEVAVRAFYAQQDARTPLVAAVLTTAAFITLAALLAFPLGAPGIALANTLAFSGEAILLLFLLNRKHPGVLRLGRTLLRVGLASALAAAAVYPLAGLPLPGLLLAVLSLAAGGLIILPFIWPEIKILVKL